MKRAANAADPARLVVTHPASPMHHTGEPTSTRDRTDGVACTLLFLFTCWYCASAPYNLYVYDEGYFLYEAKRIVDGEVFYRDFFNIVTPLAWYVMAAAYWLFGVSMATARTTMAVVHGVIAVGMVIACRTLGVRRSIAVVVGLSEAAVCYMAIERAAPHWFGTLFCVLILVALLRRPLTVARNALIAGVLVGALLLTQQQRGVAMMWVPMAVLVIDQRLLVAAPERSWRRLVECATLYAAGILVLVVPVMLAFVVLAGFENVWVALVHYPLFNYRNVNRAAWGEYNPIQDPYIGPIVKYLSIVVPTAAMLRCIWQWRTGQDPYTRRRLAVVLLLSLGALLGITYVPGYGYLVLVGPIWFILIAEMLDRALRMLARRWRRTWLVSMAVVGGFALLLSVRLWDRRRELTAQWPYLHDTPFGRMNFASEADIATMEAVRNIVGATQARAVFIYPTAPGLYLLTGTKNITRFQVMVPGYSSPEHVQEVIDTLETRRQPFVIRNWIWMNNAIDPILRYLMQNYEKVPLPYPPKQMRTVTLFQRKPESSGSRTF